MKFLSGLLGICTLIVPCSAYASWGIVDSLDVSPVVPLVFDAFMEVATGGYEFFVEGTSNMPGIIYLLIWLFFALTLCIYSIKIFLPARWTSLLGFSGGGDLYDEKTTGMTIIKSVFQPGMRTLIATVVLLQIKPIYVTEWLINPFLEFGSIYTQAITHGINGGGTVSGTAPQKVTCPEAILSRGWISENSCNFITQPIADITHVNNQMIKRGLDFIHQGLRGLITLIPHGGTDFMNLISGILLVTTFTSCNLFMALLIIQALFGFGMSLILYPFYVLTWVAKPKNKEGWFDVWPAFSGITKALQTLIITMISCAFILTINIAVVRALFNWNSSVFVVAAGGSATSNVPTVANHSMGFGDHSVMWLSAILTFYLMLRIFDLTRERLTMYSQTKPDLYNNVTNDLRIAFKKTKAGISKIKEYSGLSESSDSKGKKK